jgi:hypothetical protein
MAAVGDVQPNVAVASAAAAAAPIDTAAYLSSFPAANPVTPATNTSQASTANSDPSGPVFRSLFQVGERTQPVSPAVHELWGNSSSLTSVATATSVASVSLAASPPTQGVSVPQPLDLFSDRSGTFSS